MIKLTDTVKHLIIINVLLFVATKVITDVNFYDLLAMHYIDNPVFKPWQIVTHMFMHGSELHLLFNMLALWMFGSSVEYMLGRNKFLMLYFGAGLGAVLFNLGIDYFQFNATYNQLIQDNSASSIQLMLESGSYGHLKLNEISVSDLKSVFSTYNTPLVGASGALYGVLVAFGVMQPKAKMGLIFLPIMIEARIFIPLLLLADMFLGVFSIKGDNIAHFAHIGGAIVGFILIWYLKKDQFKRWY